MAKFILWVESNCNDPTREDEFNNWYNDVHLPDILGTKGFVKATRHELVQPDEGKGRYIAIYEIETDNIDSVMAAHQNNVKQKRQQGRFTELIEVTSRGIYKQVFSYIK